MSKALQVILSVYVGLFGFTLFISGFVRAGTIFFADFVIETAFSIMGIFLMIGTLLFIKTTTRKKLKVDIEMLLLVVVVSAILYIVSIQVWVPTIISLIFGAGYKIGETLLQIVSTVWGSKFSLPAKSFFLPIPFMSQVGFVYLLSDTLKFRKFIKYVRFRIKRPNS